jgi:uncharacterized protein
MEEALRIMREAGCSKSVIRHCLNVVNAATDVALNCVKNGLKVDLELVKLGALLHDIGRSQTHGIKHGVAGGRIAEELGLSEHLVKIIERHIGAGLPPEEAKKIGLPNGNFVPETIEEKIVAYSDKLVEGNKQVDIEVTVEKLTEELGKDHPALDRLRALHEEIVNLAGQKI